MKGMKGASVLLFGVISAFLVIVIALTLLPTIADQSIGVSGTGNMTGVTATLMDLIPLFYVIGIIVITLVSMKVSGKL